MIWPLFLPEITFFPFLRAATETQIIIMKGLLKKKDLIIHSVAPIFLADLCHHHALQEVSEFHNHVVRGVNLYLCYAHHGGKSNPRSRLLHSTIYG